MRPVPRVYIVACTLLALPFLTVGSSMGAPMAPALKPIANNLVPHKALYDIDLVATHSGSQIINISGQMTYEWRPECEAWQTDHSFTLSYEYADAPGMKISSNFSTYEEKDGGKFNFTSRRLRDGALFQEIRGHAKIGPEGGMAHYALPEPAQYDLPAGAVYPVGHTLELIRRARAGDKFYNAVIFDGSDEDGPIEINSFIGKSATAPSDLKDSVGIDKTLLASPARHVRMAFFPLQEEEPLSDYEMSMIIHENGVVSDMVIEYDDFSVRQKLIALDRISAPDCGSSR